MRASTRRGLLGGAAALATAPTATARPHPDAELIRRCHLLAEDELDSFYEYVTAPDGEEDDDRPCDWASLHWIAATPATTPEGWQAKALAVSAWERDYFDGVEGDRGSSAALLASLLREMAGPARDPIVARLAAKYGPLPMSYTPNGMWLGSQPAVSSEPLSARVHPDAELIASCAEFDRIEHRYKTLIVTTEEGDARDEAAEALSAEGEPLVSQILATVPTTSDGVRALVKTIMTENPDILRDRSSRSAFFVAHLLEALTQNDAIAMGRA